jgi:hypothetical protein
VTAPTFAGVVGWPGQSLPVQVHVETLAASISSGARIGVLRVDLSGQQTDVALRTSRRLLGPSVIWRLTRL